MVAIVGDGFGCVDDEPGLVTAGEPRREGGGDMVVFFALRIGVDGADGVNFVGYGVVGGGTGWEPGIK